MSTPIDTKENGMAFSYGDDSRVADNGGGDFRIYDPTGPDWIVWQLDGGRWKAQPEDESSDGVTGGSADDVIEQVIGGPQ